MTTHDLRRDTPDWMPRAAHCRTCGSDDWHSDCPVLEVPANVVLSDN